MFILSISIYTFSTISVNPYLLQKTEYQYFINAFFTYIWLRIQYLQKAKVQILK